MPINNMTDPLAKATDVPRLDILTREWGRCGPDRRQQPDVADDIRFCRWPGQHIDGKKHDYGDKQAFPWEGASDTQPQMADRIINETVALLTTSFWRAMVKPKASDKEIGAYAVTLADYFINTVLYESLIREIELAAQYREHYGWFILHPIWERKLGLQRRKVKLQELAMIGEGIAQRTGDPTFASLGQIILSPELEDAAITMLQQIYEVYAHQQVGDTFDVEIPPLRASVLRKALKGLRSEEQEAEVVVPYVCKDGPSITALKPYDEIFVPVDTAALDSARVIIQREWVSEADLRSRIVSDKYDPAWVERAIKERGKSSNFWSLPEGTPGNALTGSSSLRNPTSQVATTGHDLIEVLHCTYRAVDPDDVPAIYLTTIQPLVLRGENDKPIYARHVVIDYPHGEYPYVGGAREYISRQFTSSRGVAEVVRTRQQEKKALLDSTIDRTSITVLPPVNTYPTPHGGRYRFGPAIQNTVQMGREPKFMDLPSGQGMAEGNAVIERIDFEVDNYFGLMSEKVPPTRSQAMQTSAVSKFLLTCSKAIQQIVSLAQKFMSDQEFSSVTGAPIGWLDARRDKPGVLSVSLEFDVRELDPELLTSRIKAMNEAVLPTDVAGVINRSKWVELQVRAINPAWSRELIQPVEPASQKIYNDVRNDIAQMFLGNEAQYVQNDPTAQTKLQYASQIIASNPNYQQALQEGGRFSELLQNWTKNLQFSVTQEANKQVGAIGVQPVSQTK